MDKNNSDRIQQLCSLIAAENDHQKFLALVEELNRILSGRNAPLDSENPGRQKDS